MLWKIVCNIDSYTQEYLIIHFICQNPRWKSRIWSCCAEKHRPTLYAGKRVCPDTLHTWSLVPTCRCVSLGWTCWNPKVCRCMSKRAEMKTGGERFEIVSALIYTDILLRKWSRIEYGTVLFQGSDDLFSKNRRYDLRTCSNGNPFFLQEMCVRWWWWVVDDG